MGFVLAHPTSYHITFSARRVPTAISTPPNTHAVGRVTSSVFSLVIRQRDTMVSTHWGTHWGVLFTTEDPEKPSPQSGRCKSKGASMLGAGSGRTPRSPIAAFGADEPDRNKRSFLASNGRQGSSEAWTTKDPSLPSSPSPGRSIRETRNQKETGAPRAGRRGAAFFRG